MSARKAISPLLVLLCLSLMSFKGMNKKVRSNKTFHNAKEMTQKRFCYLRATMQNLKGDKYVYSEVIEFDAKTWQLNKYTVLTDFEDELHEMYPESIFDMSIESVEDTFKTEEKAIESREEAIRSLSPNKRKSRKKANLKIELLKRGQTVRF
ncbi:MAG: hypothetical protein ACI85I_000733 [Arenicella sp.]|jgi:hypothetical protein